jgi:hypothetical protein
MLSALLCLASKPMSAAEAGDAGRKDYILFLGANLEIKQGDTYYRMTNFQGEDAIIQVGDQLQPVTFRKISAYRIRRVPVVGAAIPAVITHLTAERAYTPQSDPRRVWAQRESNMMDARDDQVDMAAGAMANASSLTPSLPVGVTKSYNPSASEQAGNNLEEVSSQPQGGFDDHGTYMDKMQDELDKKLFDAIDVNFEVSSDRTIAHPYALLVADFKEKDSSDTQYTWIYIKALDPIDREPQKVRMFQGGLPPGFLLQKYSLHLYDGGQEVGTNLSENRMDLTRGEMFEYLDLQYMVDHTGQTLAPAVIRNSSRVDLREAADASQLGRAFDVSVDKDGKVTGVSAADGSAISPDIMSLWQDVRFYPALDKGNPVAATLRASLADFTR